MARSETPLTLTSGLDRKQSMKALSRAETVSIPLLVDGYRMNGRHDADMSPVTPVARPEFSQNLAVDDLIS
jgi:hypothetical protein